MPDDPLGPLADGPLPPLAPAAAVRARGEQRRRRVRAALAGAGSLAIGLVAVTAYALVAPGGRDTVRPAPLASAAPSVQVEPLQAALLDPEDVQGRVDVEGRWSLRATEDLPFDLLQDACGRSSVGRDAALRFLDGPDGYAVGEHLAVHADAAEAAQALSARVAALAGCTEGGVSYRVADDSDRVVGERLEGESVTPFSLERVGRVVVTVVLRGPAAMAPRLAEAAAAEVRAVFPDAAPPAASPAPASPAPASRAPVRPARPAGDLLLTVEDADGAEPGAWQREGQDVEGPLLDPCTGGTAYPRDADVVDSAVTELVSRREAGGTTVVQTVTRYSDPTAARDAFDGYERAVRACPERREPSGPAGSRSTHEAVEQTEVAGVRTLYVRAESTCDDQCSTGHVYYAVQQTGDVVSVLLAAMGEDGDPGVRLIRPFARAAAGKLA